VLALGQVFNGLAGSCGTVLAMTGLQTIVLKTQIFALTVNALVSWFLITRWGAMGVAIGASTGLVVWNFLMVLAVLRRINVNTTLIRPRSIF
jgi:O-antigen/teichoic acid export membrane protein